MARKRHKAEEIVAFPKDPASGGKLRQVDVMVAQGTALREALRSIGVSQVTYNRWRTSSAG